MSLEDNELVYIIADRRLAFRRTYLQCVLAREALVTVGARERLHGQVNPLVALQVMIPVEALGALITLEWSIGSWTRHTMVGYRVSSVEMLGVGDVSTIETRQNARLHSAHHRHGTIRAVDVGHDGTRHCGERIRRPMLAREAQRRLAARTLKRHARARVNSKTSVASNRIGAGVDGRESGLMARRGVERMHLLVIGVIRWQRCRGCSMTGVIKAHGD
jgi:hypothetical protein